MSNLSKVGVIYGKIFQTHSSRSKYRNNMDIWNLGFSIADISSIYDIRLLYRAFKRVYGNKELSSDVGLKGIARKAVKRRK